MTAPRELESIARRRDAEDARFRDPMRRLPACPMEGCVLWRDHAGQHTSKPYWSRELRDSLANR